MKIIKIGAIWCPACIITGNALKRLQKEYDFELVELDADMDDISEYHPDDILPILIIMKDDKEIDRLNGEKSYKQIEEVLKKYE